MKKYNREELYDLMNGKEEDKEMLINEILNMQNKKKYGLVWEEDNEKTKEQFEKSLETHLPTLEEIKDKEIKTDNSKPTNLLIEGDNYHSLKLLQTTHKNKIDVIYIDPPYNTGNKDFIYNDKYIDKEDGYRHSKWINFMSKRLKLARELLSEEGVIFISIDDNEFAQLKLLCDEIFGEDNFINNISIKTKTSSGASGGGEDRKFKKNIEYLLIYSKKREFSKLIIPQKKRKLIEVINDKKSQGKAYEYNKILINYGERKYIKSIKDGKNQEIKIFKNEKSITKSIKEIMKEEGLTEEETYFKYFDKIFRVTNAQTSIRTRVNDAINKTNELISIDYVPITGKNKGNTITNYYINGDLLCWLSDTSIKNKQSILKLEKIGTLWDDLSWTGISNEGGVVFNNGKKPLSFIKRILNTYPKKNAIIIDFFAGSGTLGQSVLELNKEDGGNRQFILCTNNENNICEEVTYQRLNKVINGYKTPKGKDVERLGGNLKYYKCDFVEKEYDITDNIENYQNYAIELLKIKENVFDLYKEEETYSIFTNDKKMLVCIKEIDNSIELNNVKKELDNYGGDKVIYINTAEEPISVPNELEGYKEQIHPMPKEIIDILSE